VEVKTMGLAYLDQVIKLGQILVARQNRSQVLFIICHYTSGQCGQAQRNLEKHRVCVSIASFSVLAHPMLLEAR
jgi:hypothetical protein